MPTSCCVPYCKSNYRNNGPNISAFRFPNSAELTEKWLSAIKRENFIPKKSSRICELHFEKDQVERSTKFDTNSGDILDVPLLQPRLKKGAVPTIFPNNALYYSRRKQVIASKSKKPAPKEEITLEIVDDDQQVVLAEHKYCVEPVSTERIVVVDHNHVTSIADLISKSSTVAHGSDWLKSNVENALRYFYIGKKLPVPRCSVLICFELKVTIIFEDVEIKALDGAECKIPVRVDNVKQIQPILEMCSDFIEHNFNQSNQDALRLQLVNFFTPDYCK